MDRRAFLELSAGSAGIAAMGGNGADAGADARESAGGPAAGPGAAGRPEIALDPHPAGGWRVVSWDWRDGAWRPCVAHARAGAAGWQVDGPVAAADRASLAARLGESRAAAGRG